MVEVVVPPWKEPHRIFNVENPRNDKRLFGIFIGSILLRLTVSNELLARTFQRLLSVKTSKQWETSTDSALQIAFALRCWTTFTATHEDGKAC